VRRPVRASDLIATSLTSYAEVRSALARKCRGGRIARAALNRLRQEFERDWARLHVLPVDDALVRKAGDLTAEHALRALDALHLASADNLQAVLRAEVTVAGFDGVLNGAAKKRGLQLL
jgi:predicted nucleic acid-binding protein